MQKVENSMLIPAIGETKVIPHGVNLSLFCPVDKKVVRDHLGLRQDEKVLLFTANGIRHTTMKDYQTLRSAVQMVAKRPNGQKLVFIALGETGQAEQIGKTRISFVPYQNKPEVVAHYYQAADIYLHASHADTFPTTILEALACGTTVIATSVGGISEQVKSLEHCAKSPDCLSYQSDNATGLLVIPGDAEAMAQAIITLLTNDSLRSKLSGNAARDARERFDLNRLAEQYLQWYQEIRQQQKCKRPEMVSAG
jgi:glycosyltransferase involved in cell wall biosynthesis